MRALAALLCLAAPAVAQDIRFDIAPTEACVEQGGAAECIGEATSACFNATDYGFTTAGMIQCISAEYEWWDARLNRVYRDLKAEFAAQDADMPDYAPDQVEALVEMQRAWIAFRDAKCLSEMAFWGGGTGGGPAHVNCMMYETAEQVLYLETRFPMR